MSGTTTKAIPINFVPGFYRNSTPLDNTGHFIDGDKIRFRSGKVEKLGGNQKEIMSGSLRGVPRTLFPFLSLDEQKYLAVGTSRQLAIALGGMYSDVTPIDRTSTLNNVITTVNLSPTVTITHTLHGARNGDTILVSPSVTYNGVTISGSYQITLVNDNSYRITTTTNATSSGGPGGGSITINYLLPDGVADTSETGFGWGIGPWGGGTWGTPRASGQLEDARVWCIQPWGEDILALPRYGALYYWDTSVGTGTRAQEVSTAPSKSNFMLVSSSFRSVVLFGTETTTGDYDPLLIRWSDSENYTDFNPLSPGTIAGEYRLQKGTKIVSACETRSGEILVATDAAIYIMKPSTGEEVFGVFLLSDTAGCISPKGMFDVDGTVVFVSTGGFKYYDGVVRDLPTTIDNFLFSSEGDGYLNFRQAAKFYFAYTRKFQELVFWWADDSNTEINRYAIIHLTEGHVCDGTMQRTAYSDNGIYENPYAYRADGTLYTHEVSRNDDGAPMDSYVELGYYNVEEGDYMMFVDRIIPDGAFDQQLSLSLKAKKFPNDVSFIEKLYNFIPTTGQVKTRIRGRLISLKIRSNIYNGYFRLGKFTAYAQKDGKR